jgi:mannosyltransferase OCH1-like enzyme
MVPNIFHFIFGLHKDFGGLPFSFIHYLAIKSAYECNKPKVIKFYYKYEPSGKWWERSKKYLTLIKIEPPTRIFGNPLKHYAHQADVLRLEILFSEGGIYLDLDVICLNSFKPLLKYDCTMGRELRGTICNAVIFAKPKAEFLKKWYKEYSTFRSKGEDKFWNEHGCMIPAKIAYGNPKIIHIEDQFSFFWPSWAEPNVLWRIPSSISERRKDQIILKLLNQSYCTHLWAHAWKDYLKILTPEYIKETNNIFSKLCRKYL